MRKQYLHFSMILVGLILTALAACSEEKLPVPVPTVPQAASMGVPPEPASKTPTGRPTFTLIPSRTPIPASYFLPTPDPASLAIISHLIETIEPEVTVFSASPDGKWVVSLLTYGCTTVNEADPQEYAYEALQIMRKEGGEEHVIDDQLQVCGGVGAYGLGEVAWSPDSRYYYYTDAREGSPDGGSPGWLRTVYRYNTRDGQAATLGPSVLSPDGKWIASTETWADGQMWRAPLSLTIRDLGGKLLARYESAYAVKGWGYHCIAWSPDRNSLAYAETGCPDRPGGCSSSVYLVDLDLQSRTRLLLDWEPGISAVAWKGLHLLEILDIDYSSWLYHLDTGLMEQQPR